MRNHTHLLHLCLVVEPAATEQNHRVHQRRRRLRQHALNPLEVLLEELPRQVLPQFTGRGDAEGKSRQKVSSVSRGSRRRGRVMQSSVSLVVYTQSQLHTWRREKQATDDATNAMQFAKAWRYRVRVAPERTVHHCA